MNKITELKLIKLVKSYGLDNRFTEFFYTPGDLTWNSKLLIATDDAKEARMIWTERSNIKDQVAFINMTIRE
jgi:hypothetical protein